MSLDDEIRTIRASVALSEFDHVSCLRVSGAGALATIDRVCPRELFLRDGQILHGLLLREDATPLVDVYIARDDEAFFLLAEGVPSAELIAHLRAHAAPDTDIVELQDNHRLLSINGPFAWELLTEVAGAALLGVPYLTFCHLDEFICFRAGKTGEYGYDLLVPEQGADSLRTRLQETGAAFDIGIAGLPALDQCALENAFFNIRREVRPGLTPLELQLQCRVSRRKTDFVGAQALRQRRVEGVRGRITHFTADEQVDADATVNLEGQDIGEVLAAGRSPTLGKWVGSALLRRELASAGVERFTAGDGATVVTTVAPPVMKNASLFVNPRKHSYATRDEIAALAADA